MITTACYLIVKGSKRGGYWDAYITRVTKKSPSLSAGEVAIYLELSIPEALFQRPQLQASITVPEDSVSAPVITAEVQDNIREVLSKELGIDLNISLVEPNTQQD